MNVKELRKAINDPEIKDDEDVAIFMVDGPDGNIVKYGLDIVAINADDTPIMIFVDSSSGED